MLEFEKIYTDYFGDVFLYIRRLSGDVHIAEEITGDTFLRALRSIDSFRGDCDMRVWLCQIAKNLYYTYLKKSKRTVSLDDEGIPPPVDDGEASVEDEVIRREDAARIRALLHDLPEPYKEVFMWRVFAEMNFKQIAQIFHKTENWACVTYHRARQKIMEQLEENRNA